MRAAGAVFAGTFAFAMSAQPWCAVPAATCATFLLIGAVTGWCPTKVLGRRATQPAPTHGYPDATRVLDLLGSSRGRNH